MHRWGDSGSADYGDVHYYNYDDGALFLACLLFHDMSLMSIPCID